MTDSAQKLFNKFQEAVRDGTKSDIERCIKTEGFPVNFASPTGRGPLHLAAERGDDEAVKYLIEQGADCTKLDKKGASCMHYAAKVGSCRCIEILKNHISPSGLPAEALNDADTAFHWAVWGIKFDAASMLYELQPDLVNKTDSEGDTALHWACLNSRCGIVKKLIQNFNADTEVISSQVGIGAAPLHIAATQGDLDICKFLIDNCDVQVNVKDSNGDTPLHLAVSFEHLSVVTYLLQSKLVDPLLLNNNNQTPLDVAIDLRIEGGFQQLLEAAVEGRLPDELRSQEKKNRASAKLEEVVAAAKRAGAF